jgi:hypothetical protein
MLYESGFMATPGQSPLRTKGQEFCLISFHSDSRLAVNFHGAYPSEEKATLALKTFREEGYTDFDISIADMYNFGIFPPPASVPREYFQEPLKALMRQASDQKVLPMDDKPRSFQTPPPEKKDESVIICQGVSSAPKDQEWFVVAVSKTKDQELAINPLGAFPDVKAADEFCQKLGKMGFTKFQLFKIKMNHWLDFPPPAEETTSQFQQDVLKPLMQNKQETDRRSAEALNLRVANQKLENELFASRRKAAKSEKSKEESR